MTLDLLIVVLVLVFAALGAAQGAARQVAHWVALFLAVFCARVLGPLLGPRFADSTHTPQFVGTVAATFTVFILLMVAIRYALTTVLRRILAGRDPKNRTADRVLGFSLGALKVLALSFIALCALAFVEDNLVFAGRRVGVSPSDSKLFALAKSHNLFAAMLFSPVHDLVRVAAALSDPKKVEALKSDPAYQALLKDKRFDAAVHAEGLRRAAESGDVQQLLRNPSVLQLISDPTAAKRLAAVAAKAS